MSKNAKPESLMMSFGYDPKLAMGSIKPPIFQTSTFVFESAEEGKAFFEVAYGLRQANEGEVTGMIYSRINNPNLDIVEKRLCAWEGAEDCAVFESGMAAISTTLLSFLNAGDLVLIGNPLYGGTNHFVKEILPKYNVHFAEFKAGQSRDEIIEEVNKSGRAHKLKMVYIETPANPTNDLIDIEMSASVAAHFSGPENKVLLGVDNTYMGPLWQKPLQHGADLVLYSATKYIGGHSDVVAGASLGSAENIKKVKGLRTYLGSMAGPNTAWLLSRSLETIKARMDIHAANADKIARFLHAHPAVEKVYFPGLLTEKEEEQLRIKNAQCLSNGAMISFDVKGGEKEAFQFLNALKLVKLAVSLGSTESLAEHPYTMTHSGVNAELKKEFHISEKMVRLSVGIENTEDIIADLEQALSKERNEK